MKKSIMLVCKYTSLPSEGMLTKLYYIAKYLSDLGHEVVLVRGTGHYFEDKKISEYSERNNFKLVTLRSLSYGRGSKIRRLISWFIFEIKVFLFGLYYKKVDIYFASSPSILTLLTCALLSKIKRSELVIDIRDIWPLTIIEEGGYSAKNILVRFFSWIEKFSARNASAIVSSIPNLRDYYENVLNIEKPHFFLPICLDEEVPSKVSINGRSLKQENVLNIGYIGSIGVSNNLDTFFEVIAKLNNTRNVHFHIFGDGEFRKRYINYCQNFSNVTFYGHIARDQINSVYEKIDIGYVSCHESSLWKYGQSLNKLLSYMENAVPVIMSYPLSGYKTMVNEAGCGWFIQPNRADLLTEAVNELKKMKSSDLLKMGLAGQAWVDEHRQYAKQVSEFSNFLEYYQTNE